MSREPAVLFVGHDAYRAGAQIALLRLLTWLRSRLPARPILVLGKGGDLLEEYKAVTATYLLDPPKASKLASLTRRLRWPSSVRPSALDALGSVPVGLMYLNSVASLNMLGMLRGIWRCPVVCHVHELEMGIRSTVGPIELREALGRVDAFVAVSEAVRDNLCVNHGVPSLAVHRIYGMIPESPNRGARETASVTRERLGVPSGAFVVGGCGTLDWRKGPDVFVQVARHMVAQRSDLLTHFVWVGGDDSGFPIAALRHDVERCGLAGRVHLIGATADPEPYFAAFDAFLLTSREDPFPLVCLEAAAIGTPIVCFDRAGGMPEFVGAEAGFVVPYLDISAAAAALASLADSLELRQRLGTEALRKARAHHVDRVGKDVLHLIETHYKDPAQR